MLLSSTTREYVTPSHVPTMGKKAHEFPDSVVDVYLQKTRAEAPAKYAGVLDPRNIPDPRLDLEASKNLAVEALTSYDRALGDHAREILDHRTRAETFSDGKKPLQLYVAAGSNEYPPDMHGTVQYDYLNNTIDDAIMLGHEAGHGIADDNIRKNAFINKDGAAEQCADENQLEHMQETQAYFIQHIVYDHLMNDPGIDPKVAEAARQHFAATMTRNIYNLSIAHIALDAKNAINQGKEFSVRNEFDARLSPGWEQDEWAKGVFDVIVAAQKAKADPAMPDNERKAAEEKLDVEADYVHGRPLSLLNAYVLFKKTKEDPSLKKPVLDAVMAGKGPQNIVSALWQAGIVDDVDLGTRVEQAIALSKNPARDKQPRPDANPLPAVNFTPT